MRIEELNSIYNIGPTPLREALQTLSANRLLVTDGNRGFKVAPLINSEFADLNIARTSIEKEAIRLSVAGGDNQWEAQLVAAHFLLKRKTMRLVQLSIESRIPGSRLTLLSILQLLLPVVRAGYCVRVPACTIWSSDIGVRPFIKNQDNAIWRLAAGQPDRLKPK